MNSIILRFIRSNIHIMLAKCIKYSKLFRFDWCGGLRHTKRWYLWHDYRYKGKEVNWVKKKVNHLNYMCMLYIFTIIISFP